MDILYKYEDAFSSRDEIGTCTSIELEMDITDKSQFFVQPHQIKEEKKAILDEETNRLCFLGIIKECFQHIQVQSC